jgi:hypothetical protein
MHRGSAWVSAGPVDGVCTAGVLLTGGGATVELDIDGSAHGLAAYAGPAGELPAVTADRRLLVRSAAIQGPERTLEAIAILDPVRQPDVDALGWPAAVRIGPAGATVETAIPAQVRPGSEWEVWLRIGPPGGPPPDRLGITLHADPAGRLSATRSIER